uniref:Uncharacterized protein n=1 Tax=Glossina morsitans morsitans TaxID=37546 RepID=A0A1B0G353_GLOMM
MYYYIYMYILLFRERLLTYQCVKFLVNIYSHSWLEKVRINMYCFLYCFFVYYICM